ILLILFVLLFTASAEDSDREQKLDKTFRAIDTEKNVLRLESIAQYEASDSVDGEQLGASAFMFRSAAYIRLGAIGSVDSIAAIQRIRLRAQQVVPNTPLLPLTFIENPARHEGAIGLKPLAETTASDGTQYAIVYGPMMGDIDFFLVMKKANEDLWH